VYDNGPVIESPVLVIGCARSGTTLLYTILSEVANLWSLGYESRAIIEHYHSPAARGWESGALSAGDLTPGSRDWIRRAFEAQAAPGDYWRRVNALRARLNGSRAYTTLKRHGRGRSAGAGVTAAVPAAGLGVARAAARLIRTVNHPRTPIRLLEKTPENCLRLPFLQALFPDARVVFLVREGRANVHSLLEGWRHPHLFPGYNTPLPVTSPGQTRGRWAFTLIPGWRELVNRPLAEICARQWVACNAAVLDFAASPGSLPVLAVRYEDLIAAPDETLEEIGRFLTLQPGAIPAIGRGLPEVNAVTPPGREKWRTDSAELARVASIMEPMMTRLGYGGLVDDVA